MLAADPEATDGWVHFQIPTVGWVSVALAHVDGLPQIVELKIGITSPHQDPIQDQKMRQWVVDQLRKKGTKTTSNAPVITAELLRGLPLAEMRAAAAAHQAGDHWFDEFKTVARQRGKALPDEHYQQVAQVYRDAVARRQPPLKAVEERFSVTRAGASRAVKRSRELGFLGYPARPGVAGAEETRSPFKPKKGRRPRNG
jgi:hypothetical protein